MTDLMAALRAAPVACDGVVGERTENQKYMHTISDYSEADQDLIRVVAHGQPPEAVIADRRGIHLIEHSPTRPDEKRFQIKSLPNSRATGALRWILIVLVTVTAFGWVLDRRQLQVTLQQQAKALPGSESAATTAAKVGPDTTQLQSQITRLSEDLDNERKKSPPPAQLLLPPVVSIETCQQLIDTEASSDRRLIEWWLSGYLRGARKPDSAEATASSLKHLEERCAAHPPWPISKALK